MAFFTFQQNNSGGDFVRNDVLDMSVCVEANSEEEAVQRALTVGVYFDGCEAGLDCECCGDRWYNYPEGPFESPSNYEEGDAFGGRDNAVVHYLDGTRVRPNAGGPVERWHYIPG